MAKGVGDHVVIAAIAERESYQILQWLMVVTLARLKLQETS